MINVPGFAGVDLLINIFGIMVFLRRCIRCKKLEDLLLCVFTKNIQSSLSGLTINSTSSDFIVPGDSTTPLKAMVVINDPGKKSDETLNFDAIYKNRANISMSIWFNVIFRYETTQSNS